MSERRRLRGRSQPWSRAVAMLVVVAIAATARALPVRAADTGAEHYEFYLSYALPGNLDHLCIDEPVVISITAERVIVNAHSPMWDLESGESSPPVQLYGVTIDGSVTNGAIATLSPPTQITSGRATPPGSVTFTFLPRKIGSTQLVFKQVPGGWFDGLRFMLPFAAPPIDVTVVDCDLELTTNSIWRIPGPANQVFVAIIHEAKMKLDENGGISTTASVTWTGGGGPVGECSGSIVIGASTAKILGIPSSRRGRHTIDVEFQRASVETVVTCRGVPGHKTYQVTPEPLTFTVPDTGGGTTLRQVLTGPQKVRGSAHILVAKPGG